MVNLSICIEMVFDDEPFHKRIRRAKEAGADAVEFWDWREKDLKTLESTAKETGTHIIGCTAGGVLTDPNSIDDTVDTICESIETAEKFGIPTLIATSGPDQEQYNRESQRKSIIEVLSQVAPRAEEAGVTIALEPLNVAVDHPNSYLFSSDEGFSIIGAVGSPAITLLYDVYHQQITEGNVIQTITNNIDQIGHIHIADVPGRNEPGTGELNYKNIFAAIDDTDYEGYMGCEFSPTVDPEESLVNTLNMTK